MAIADRDYDSKLNIGNKLSPLVMLVGINTIIFVALSFARAICVLKFPEGGGVDAYFNENILSLTALNPSFNDAISKFWTLISFSFTHLNVWDLLANMIWLWVFGFLFIDLTGSRRIIPLAIYGAIAGAISILILSAINPAIFAQSNSLFYGSGSVVMAIAAAAITINPKYKIFPFLSGGIPIWVLGTLYLVLTLATTPYQAPYYHLSYIAGAFMGFLYIFLIRKGIDLGGWMSQAYDKFLNLYEPKQNVSVNSLVKETYFYKTDKAAPYKKSLNNTQDVLDAILEKIHQKGVESLSSEEKELLEKLSKDK